MRTVSAQKGQLVIGKSLPMQENGLERHLMAIYDALAEYCRSNCKIDEIRSIHEETHTTSSSSFSDSVSVDFSVLHNWIDANGVEYVFLDISPGNHIFYIMEISHETDGLYDYKGTYCLFYDSAHFFLPAVVQIKEDEIYYTIGVNTVQKAAGGSLIAKSISKKHFGMDLKDINFGINLKIEE